MLLEQLAQRHKDWIKIAVSMCKDTELAKDIVQDMYIKAYELNKPISSSYVWFILRSLHIDYIRNKRELTTDEATLSKLIESELQDEIPDYEKREYLYELIELEMSQMKATDQIIIQRSVETSKAAYSRQSKISVTQIRMKQNKLKKLVWQRLNQQSK